MKEKLCPFRFGQEGNDKCIQKKCALWLDLYEACAIRIGAI